MPRRGPPVCLKPAIAALALAATMLSGVASAQASTAQSGASHPVTPPVRPAAPPPRLIVAIAVDQFSADLFAQYRQRFTGGLARLTAGAVFPSAYQSHAASETCPGHATLLTGVHPARSGIIANWWFDPALARADKRVYCAEDESDPASTSRDPVVSALHLRVPTLGEYLKRANPQSRNVAVSGKDRAVIMMGGHSIDQGYWYRGGAFVTFPDRPLAPAVGAVNAGLARTLKSGAPALAAPAWCAARGGAVDAGKAGQLGAGRFALAPNQPDALRGSPRLDAATLDLAARLADELKLGRGPAPDVLSVSLSATDYIGHATGHQGLEMCIQMAELDRALGVFFARLDAARVDYAVMLTADHGGLDLPERLDEQALPHALRADADLAPAALGKALGAQLGIAPPSGPLIHGDGPGGDLYIARNLPADQRARVRAALVARLASHPQVAAVFTADELARAPLPAGSPQDWTLRDRARLSFDPARSGDVVALLARAIVPIPQAQPGFVATHGSPWDYDRRVPLLFWRNGLAGFEQPAPVETVDIAPSLAALLHLPVPEGSFDGRCLDLDGTAGNTCG